MLPSIEVLKPGLETTIQDYPGRVGMLRHGIPPSGPMDDWSFRAANWMIGNAPGASGLECQLLGPTLRFHSEVLCSICGADMQPRLDGIAVEMWSRIRAKPGQVLSLGPAIDGARTYISFLGGLDVPKVMGSRATYAAASLGGLEGRALRPGDRLTLGAIPVSGQAAREHAPPPTRPPVQFPEPRIIRAIPGPNEDWISQDGHARFFSAEWRISARSNRVGVRLEGPVLDYSSKAYDKPVEAGSDPSNIVDIGYPIGGINLAGNTPIILMHDCITLGGFIVPYTVPSCEFWKLAQCRPWEVIRFKPMDLEDAQDERRRIDSFFGQ